MVGQERARRRLWRRHRRAQPLTRPALSARGALGLRGRIVGAVLVTTVATLAVAAVALLGPLEQSLRNSALTTLKHDLPNHPTQDFKSLDLEALTHALRDPALSSPAQLELQGAQQKLVSRLGGGFVYVLGYPNAEGQGQLLLPAGLEGESAEADSFDDVAKAFRTHEPN